MSNGRLSDPRIIAGKNFINEIFGPVFTYQKNENSFEGIWSKPNVPLLVFSDHSLAGNTLSYHGGALAGAAGGHPLQLIFWGDWWLGPAGSQRYALIEGRTKALLQSPYFTELTQYGIPHAPVWRGSTIVTQPVPPSSAPDYNSISKTVMNLIDDLIDNDVFPDPDEGPRILFVVLLPDGFTLVKPEALGAHTKDYDWDFPFDSDIFWGGWVLPQPADPESTMWVLSHEVVEMLTDPEIDGWHTESKAAANEISDAGFSGGTAQTAFVNDVQVQSYWSNRNGATVIPIDRDYAARLRAQVNEVGRRQLDSGTFRPDPSDSAACSPQLPECCFPDRDFSWRVDAIDEVARVRLQIMRYRTPIADWKINGQTVSGESDITLNLEMEEFSGRTTSVSNRPVTLHYVASENGLDVSPVNARGNFEINIACSVRDGSITGNVLVNVIATPQLTVGFIGAELLLEDAYDKQWTACLTAMVSRYVHQAMPTGKIRPDEGINFDPGMFVRDLPGYVRPARYRRIQLMAKAARAAHVLLRPEQAEILTRKLFNEVPRRSRTLNVIIGRNSGQIEQTRAQTERTRVVYKTVQSAGE